jgi:putative ABC transport system permease protein
VAVVNESFARRYYRKPQDAIGHFFGAGAGNVKTDIQIVGVVGDAKHSGVRDDIDRTVFTSFLQEPASGGRTDGMTFYVRTWQSPESAEATLRKAMQQLDSKLVLNDLRTMQEQLGENLARERLVASLATAFGVLSAFIAATGVYGVLAYATSQRSREIGIRMALGAQRLSVVRTVLTEGVLLTGIGIAIGLPAALFFARAVRSQLFGTPTNDPVTLGVTVALVIALSLVAVVLPARRAATVDPIVALRHE